MLEKPKGSQVQTKSVVCEKGRRRRRRRSRRRRRKKIKRRRRVFKWCGPLKILRHTAGVSKERYARLQQKCDSISSSKSRNVDKNA